MQEKTALTFPHMDQQNKEQRCLAGPDTYRPEGTDQESEDQREAWLQEPWDGGDEDP